MGANRAKCEPGHTLSPSRGVSPVPLKDFLRLSFVSYAANRISARPLGGRRRKPPRGLGPVDRYSGGLTLPTPPREHGVSSKGIRQAAWCKALLQGITDPQLNKSSEMHPGFWPFHADPGAYYQIHRGGDVQ